MMLKLKKYFHILIAYLSYWFYGRPSRKLVVIGVTGTKGKSTTCRLITSVLEGGGFKTGMLSTVEFQIGEKRWKNDKKMTMLGKGQIQKLLREMVKENCTHVVIETSSEGILQNRHLGMNYDVAVFTNLGVEHAERHGGYENLRSDKGKMFSSLSKSSRKKINGKKVEKIIVVNGDDSEAEYFLKFNADKKISYGFDANEFNGVEKIIGQYILDDDQSLKVGSTIFKINILGKFNLYNGLAAIAAGKIFGLSDEQISNGLKSVRLVEGRMEFVDAGQNFRVVVDYAHEPMSLTALFSSLRKLVNGRIIAVVGSDGGGRDKQKRSKMGKIAGEMADVVVVTDVNCYDEDPFQIAEMLAGGAREVGKMDGKDLFVEVDRAVAFDVAFSKAEKGDIVAITAKGTEPYIAIAKGQKIPWDDRKVARAILEEKYVIGETL